MKWLLRYIKSSADLKLVFAKAKYMRIQGYCDSYYGADIYRRRTIFRYVFTVGGNDGSQKSNLQHVMALSTIEAQYITLTEDVKEVEWVKGLGTT